MGLDFDGLHLAFDCPETLSGFVSLPIHGLAPSEREEIDLRVSIEDRAPSAEELSAMSMLEPLFFHGLTRVLGDEMRLVVTDDRSLLSVSRRTGEITGLVSRLSLEDGYSFENTTFLIALVLSLRTHRRFHLHAGAVTRDDTLVLIAGGSGAGKSSATVSMIRAGWGYLSDDAVMLARDARGLRVTGLGRRFHLGEATVASFPGLEPSMGSAYKVNSNKRALEPSSAFPGRARRSAVGPVAVFMPRIMDRAESSLTSLSRADTLGLLTESSALVVVDGLEASSEQLALLHELAETAAGYELGLGREALSDPLRVSSLIEAAVRP